MAEIYTKPFDSVQDAIILFEERIDKNKNNRNNTSSNKDEKEGEYSKDFTNFRLQLQAKEWEKELAFSEFAASHENLDEMVNWIKLYKAETNKSSRKVKKRRHRTRKPPGRCSLTALKMPPEMALENGGRHRRGEAAAEKNLTNPKSREMKRPNETVIPA
ncbi:hypothetical protein KSP39_PZI022791 [Platanthera zijinensis]|uniref:Uncharacterized protein n=1 Tax=Platanthera zijinensis TaxID=2320716 RepID=A0AAP0FUJ0_9ASPA